MDICLFSAIVFRLCKDRGFCKHKINSPTDKKMRDPAHNNERNKQQLQRKSHSAVKFIVRRTQPYYTITYQRQTKIETELQTRQPKVTKTETATGSNTCDQCYYTGIYRMYAERRGSCKMASFSDVKLKAP